jgi:hypothetical protein
MVARAHYREIVTLIQMTMEGSGRKVIPCLKGGQTMIDELVDRFKLDLDETQCKRYVNGLIENARGNWRTVVYDHYQLILNNIA